MTKGEREERPQPWQTLKENLSSGVRDIDQVWAGWFSIMLAGYPLLIIVTSVPGVGMGPAYWVFVTSTVLATVLTLQYRPAIHDRLLSFGGVMLLIFVVVAWALWGRVGPDDGSWVRVGETTFLYLFAAGVAYLVVYPRWFRTQKVRLRLAVRRRRN